MRAWSAGSKLSEREVRNREFGFGVKCPYDLELVSLFVIYRPSDKIGESLGW
jgi:hypothetical protein